MATDTKPKVLCLMGPTGIGKSALALALAERFPAEIVSVDSAMIYRGMDIGTAKPDAAERARVPHHLLDIRDPEESYSAAEFARDATRAIEEIVARERTPILVGGTFLYFRALIAGLSPLPAADPATRAAIRGRAERKGWDTLHRELAAADPEAAARIHPRDRQRLERALELYRLSGKAPSRLYESVGPAANLDFRKIALLPDDRAALASHLEGRFEAMLAAGLVTEVRGLCERGALDAATPAARALNYRQLRGWLAGEYDYAEACRRAVVATRRYAKRQLTWLRREPDCVSVCVEIGASEPSSSDRIKKLCTGFLHVRMHSI
ncbi:MAG: tRNA (adenosine(37)-N6)-dimethylallyltransferase MiaA [Gammaproteobacteria bacterium]